MSSLTYAGCLKIATSSAKYTVGDHKSRPLFYRYLMSKACIDTKAALSHIRENLNALDSYIIKVSSNIIQFNQYVTETKSIFLNLVFGMITNL